jgi:hypothetical protein
MNKIIKKEYKILKKKYYFLKEKVINNISNGYCIIPEKKLIELRDNYEAKFVELLKNNNELVAKKKVKEEYKFITQKYYINNISKEFNEHSIAEINELEILLNIYESTFDNSKFKQGLIKIVGKNKISKIITGMQFLTAALCFFDTGNVTKNILEIILMQYSKYQLDKPKYNKSIEKIGIDKKILALKEGIDYLDKYFERKGIKVLKD